MVFYRTLITLLISIMGVSTHAMCGSIFTQSMNQLRDDSQKNPLFGMDTLQALKAHTLHDGKHPSFNPHQQATPEELESGILAIIEAMRSFSGNFLWEQYIFNKLDENAQIYGANALQYKRHLMHIYMIGRYAQSRMEGAHDSVIKGHLLHNERILTYLTKEEIQAFIKCIEDTIKKHKVEFSHAEVHKVTSLGRFPYMSLEMYKDLFDHGVVEPIDTLSFGLNPETHDVSFMDTPQTWEEKSTEDQQANRFILIKPRSIDDPASLSFYKYGKLIHYTFNVQDHSGLDVLLAYIKGTGPDGQKEVGKTVILNTIPARHIPVEITNSQKTLQTFLVDHLDAPYPMQLLRMEDKKGEIHDLWGGTIEATLKAHKEVGTPPLILQGISVPGYTLEGSLRNPRIMTITPAGGLTWSVSDEEISNTFNMPYLLESKNEEAQASNRIADILKASDQSNNLLKITQTIRTWDQNANIENSLNNLLTPLNLSNQQRDSLKTACRLYYHAHNNLKDIRNVTVNSLSSFIKSDKEDRSFIPYIQAEYSKNDDIAAPLKMDDKKQIHIAGFTSPHALKVYSSLCADQNWHNQEFYMIDANKDWFQGNQGAWDLKMTDDKLFQLIYTYFYTPRVLFHYNPSTHTLTQMSVGVMGPEMSIRLDALKRQLERQHNLPQGAIKMGGITEDMRKV